MLTPPALHLGVVVEALQGGAHVYVEKPMALSRGRLRCDDACRRRRRSAAMRRPQLAVLAGHARGAGADRQGRHPARSCRRRPRSTMMCAVTRVSDSTTGPRICPADWPKIWPCISSALLIRLLGAPQRTYAVSRSAAAVPGGKSADVRAVVEAERGLGATRRLPACTARHGVARHLVRAGDAAAQYLEHDVDDLSGSAGQAQHCPRIVEFRRGRAIGRLDGRLRVEAAAQESRRLLRHRSDDSRLLRGPRGRSTGAGRTGGGDAGGRACCARFGPPCRLRRCGRRVHEGIGHRGDGIRRLVLDAGAAPARRFGANPGAHRGARRRAASGGSRGASRRSRGTGAAFEGLAEGIDVVFHLVRSATVGLGGKCSSESTCEAPSNCCARPSGRACDASCTSEPSPGYPLAQQRDRCRHRRAVAVRRHGSARQLRACQGPCRSRWCWPRTNAAGIETVIVRLGLVCGVGASVLPAHVCQPLPASRVILFGDGSVPLPLTYIDNCGRCAHSRGHRAGDRRRVVQHRG